MSDDHQRDHSVGPRPGTAGGRTGRVSVPSDGAIQGVYPVLPEQYAGAPVEDFGVR